MDLEGFDTKFFIKFFVIWIPLTIMLVMFAPSMKWKLLFPVCAAVGIVLALTGKSIRLHK